MTPQDLDILVSVFLESPSLFINTCIIQSITTFKETYIQNLMLSNMLFLNGNFALCGI